MFPGNIYVSWEIQKNAQIILTICCQNYKINTNRINSWFSISLQIAKKEGMFIISVDLHHLLKKAFLDGFTVEILSNVTGVPIELINRIEQGNLTQSDVAQLNVLLYFLSQIYLVDVSDGKYLENIVQTLVSYFGLSYIIIAHYLQLTTDELNVFLLTPEEYPNSFILTLKLMHLFTTFVRNKKL